VFTHAGAFDAIMATTVATYPRVSAATDGAGAPELYPELYGEVGVGPNTATPARWRRTHEGVEFRMRKR
jgi:hypothetical protein